MKLLLISTLLCFVTSFAYDQQRLELLGRSVIVPQETMQSLQALVKKEQSSAKPLVLSKQAQQWPLYRAYPGLKKTLPRVVLCDLPTPVRSLPALSRLLGVDCSIKCDDVTSTQNMAFGGNKRRKAELIMADVLLQKPQDGSVDTVVSFGCIGSNLAVAMASCAQELGLNCILMLKPEPNSAVVQRNLLLMQHYGAQIHFYSNEEQRTKGTLELVKRYKQEHGIFPYVIPTGGALPLGAVGYVNAAFELKEQIKQGLIKQPDSIYISTGGTFSAGVSCGTTAGLALGLKAAKLPIKIVAVCSQPENPIAYRKALMSFISETNALLYKADKAFPIVHIDEHDIDIVCDCAGTKYGLFTQEGMEAVKLLGTAEHITLDGTYTGKAFSALVRDARAGKLAGKKVLFWNTFCGTDFSTVTVAQDYKKLPEGLHKYFTSATQPLDT